MVAILECNSQSDPHAAQFEPWELLQNGPGLCGETKLSAKQWWYW